MLLETFPPHSQEVWVAGQSQTIARLGLGYTYAYVNSRPEKDWP